MFSKTAVRRLYKLLPCSVEMSVIETLDAQNEQGKTQNLDRVIEGETELPKEPVAVPLLSDDGRVNALGRQFMTKELDMLRDIGFAEIANDDGTSMYVNSDGEVFDAGIHQAQEDGSPRMTKDGEFVQVK